MRIPAGSTFVLFALLLPATGGFAQELTMADLKDPQRMAGEELRQFLTGAKVTHKTRHGSTRYWQNNADGKFIASSDAQGFRGAQTAQGATGAGSWHISPLDQYCVTIGWRTVDEKWCVFIFRSDDKYYGVGKPKDPSARAVEFRFSR